MMLMSDRRFALLVRGSRRDVRRWIELPAVFGDGFQPIVGELVIRHRAGGGDPGRVRVGLEQQHLDRLAEALRQEAFELMLEHAEQTGGNAIVGIRYDANEVMQGVTEVLCYGTAVVAEAEAAS